jgi:hypothetical protein
MLSRLTNSLLLTLLFSINSLCLSNQLGFIGLPVTLLFSGKKSSAKNIADDDINSNAKNKDSSAPQKVEKISLQPKLLPHDDTSYLLEFHSDTCENCAQMEPVLKRLENDIGTKIRRINIFRRNEFMTLLESIGHDECGGLPFYYNRRTGQAICGATSYLNLKRLATGDVKTLFIDPPETLNDSVQEATVSKRDVGLKGILREKLTSVEKKDQLPDEKKSNIKSKKTDLDKNDPKRESKEEKKLSASERLASRREARKQRKEKSSVVS